MSPEPNYNWKSKYGGLTVSDAARLLALEDENQRRKELLAQSMLDVSVLKDLLGGKLTRSVERFAAVAVKRRGILTADRRPTLTPLLC